MRLYHLGSNQRDQLFATLSFPTLRWVFLLGVGFDGGCSWGVLQSFDPAFGGLKK